MKILVDVKDNSIKNTGDILVYSKKDECFVEMSKASYLARLTNRVKSLEDYKSVVDSKLATMANAIKKLYE